MLVCIFVWLSLISITVFCLILHQIVLLPSIENKWKLGSPAPSSASCLHVKGPFFNIEEVYEIWPFISPDMFFSGVWEVTRSGSLSKSLHYESYPSFCLNKSTHLKNGQLLLASRWNSPPQFHKIRNMYGSCFNVKSILKTTAKVCF